MLINRQYRVGKKIGAGNFGEIRVGKDEVTGRLVAIKLETLRNDSRQLALEYRHYLRLNSGGRQPGIPELFYFGVFGKSNVLVIELLGPSLEEVFDLCGRRFTSGTNAEVARQTIHLIQILHEKNIIHRDIKPENFLIGCHRATANIIHIVDLGLSKDYIDQSTGQHIPYREHKHLTGTARYMSINTHLGKEQSRRDDLEALCHMLLYFAKGSLPWQGLRAENLKERYRLICEVKRATSIRDLCKGVPDVFTTALRYARQLEFEEAPEYDYLVTLFSGYLDRLEGPFELDWKPMIDARAGAKSESDQKLSVTSESDKKGVRLEEPMNPPKKGSQFVARSNLSMTQNETAENRGIPENTTADIPVSVVVHREVSVRRKNILKHLCCCL